VLLGRCGQLLEGLLQGSELAVSRPTCVGELRCGRCVDSLGRQAMISGDARGVLTQCVMSLMNCRRSNSGSRVASSSANE
jgi:hypothetical protein